MEARIWFGLSGRPVVVGGFSWNFDHVRVIGIDLNHTELVRFLDGLADTGHGELGAGLDVLLYHLSKSMR